MPQYQTYSPVASLVTGDKILVYQNQTTSLRTIDFQDLANAVIEAGPDVSFPFVNVADYGAVGDGIEDDTIPIRNALQAAGPNSVIVFPSGKTFLTTEEILIPYNNMTLLGFGTVITSALETQVGKFNFEAKTKGRISGITFDCVYDSGGFFLNPGPISIHNSTDITVDNCSFIGVASSGVYMNGQSFRVSVVNCRFQRCFIGVFSDDDGLTYMPTQTTIYGCTFREGLGTVSTALSGAIKMSGLGTSSTYCGHIIANNTIDSCGQMGIEIQTWINDVSIVNNVIEGVAFGISVSGCSRVNVNGNTITNPTSLGIESASGSTFLNFSNNIIKGPNTIDGITLADGSGDVVINGGQISGCNIGIHTTGGSRVIINGTSFYRPAGGCINIQGGSDISINGCVMDATGSFDFIFMDANGSAIEGVSIVGNTFTGTTTNNGITLYAPNAPTITKIVATANNTTRASCPGGMWSHNSTVSPATKLIGIRSFGNIGGNSTSVQTGLNVPVSYTNVDLAYFYPYYFYEGGVIRVDATGAARAIQLPDATGLTGYEISFVKFDASVNAVTISGYSAQTINGGASVSLATQYKRVTVMSDGANWIVTQSN